jgi:hypothetical protein
MLLATRFVIAEDTGWELFGLIVSFAHCDAALSIVSFDDSNLRQKRNKCCNQAVTLKFRLLSIDFGFERFSQSTSAYITHLIRKIRASLIHPKSAPQRVHIVQNVSICLSSS